MSEKPRIIFLGTPEFAVHSLDLLLRHHHDVVAVVTAPDQPAGRGQAIQSPAVKKFAANAGLRVLQPVKLKDPEFISELQALNADLFIVVAFRMLPEVIWQMPPLGTFNLHASLLPQYRGAAPINHAIINGEKETGLTTFFLQKEIDTGEIIFQKRIKIGAEETAGELHDRMKIEGSELVLQTVGAIVSGKINTIEQGKSSAYNEILKAAPKIFRDDCRIDWSRKSAEVFNLIRGLSPYPAAFTHFIAPSGDSFHVKIFRTKMPEPAQVSGHSCIITDSRSTLSITASDGIIPILQLQLAGKKMMRTEDFLRGFRINSDWKVG